jgi:hypothetical protein
MSYAAPLIFASVLVLLCGGAFAWVWWKDRQIARGGRRRK